MSMRHKHMVFAFLTNFFLVLIAAVLFWLAHPNQLFTNGLFFLGYIALFPIFLLVLRVRVFTAPLWGILYGWVSYALFTYWLADFHPLAMTITGITVSIFLGITFFILSVSKFLFPKWKLLLFPAIWVGYEYIKTLGFLGFPYGIIGYTQWTFIPIIQSARIFGIWGISFMVVFPSAWIASVVAESQKKLADIPVQIKKQRRPFFAWLSIFVLSFLFGMYQSVKSTPDNNADVKIALIQPNQDPWQADLSDHIRNLGILKRLSDKALAENPDTDLIVWPETAFIPRIVWHYRYREYPDYFKLVRDLLLYIDRSSTAFLIGNDHGVLAADNISCDHYNAVLLFEPKKNVVPPRPALYTKIRLVPFTENFPYKKIFPSIHYWLTQADTHFWKSGDTYSVFTYGKYRFSTPICFEDNFGSVTRQFAKNGAQFLINVSNDAWSKSRSAQYQHLAMAVFRSVETGLPMARATASGQTVLIDSRGILRAMLPEFTADTLHISIPIQSNPKKTVYTMIGDIFAQICLIIVLVVLLLGIILHILQRIKKDG